MTTLKSPPTVSTVSAEKASSAGGGSDPQTNVEHLTIPQVLKQLGVDPKAGLSSAEAQKRLGQYGPNALEEKKKSELAVFLGFFWGPIPWMIEVAALMALLVKDFGDFTIIALLLVFNAVLGFWEEHQASNALAAAMPAVLSVTMALGAKLLAKKNVIVSRLESIEEMAGMEILCSDKTDVFKLGVYRELNARAKNRTPFLKHLKATVHPHGALHQHLIRRTTPAQYDMYDLAD
jgi:magnesium-transporting ATPase (P-type)